MALSELVMTQTHYHLLQILKASITVINPSKLQAILTPDVTLVDLNRLIAVWRHGLGEVAFNMSE